MKIKKLIAKGLTLAILLSNIPMSSFANEINLKENKLEVKNSSSLPEISPQMLSIIASIAVGAGITLTTDNDILDIARLVYDNYQGQKEDIETIFNSCVSIGANGVVNVGKEFLDICKNAFDSVFPKYDSVNNISVTYSYGFPVCDNLWNGSWGNFPSNLDMHNAIPGDGVYVSSLEIGEKFYFNNTNYYIQRTDNYSWSVYRADNNALVATVGSKIQFLLQNYKIYKKNGVWYQSFSYIDSSNKLVAGSNNYVSNISSSLPSYDIPYTPGSYNWDNVSNNINDNKVGIYVPANVGSLVGQVGGSTVQDGINTPSYGLINPCTQEVIIPEINNPSINIGESVRLQTNVNCSIYDAELLVQKAEQSNELTDIENARNEVNKLDESTEKENLQNRLDAIIPNLELDIKNATANLDVYIKSENMLLMSLSTNSITFEDYSGVQEIEKSNALTVNINSSLPYDLNAYLVNEIQNADGSNKIDIDRLNIKDSSDVDYKEFTDVNQKLTLKSNCSSGNDLIHNIDLKLKGDDAYPADIYKTVIKFEAEQK